MINVFISYSREDRDTAAQVAKALEAQGFKVWWDWNLVGGSEFRSEIEKALGEARRVVVLWSKHSVRSAFVIDEASEANKTRKLVPVSIDGSHPPLGFGNLHTLPMQNIGTDLPQLVAALRSEAPAPAAAIAPAVQKGSGRSWF